MGRVEGGEARHGKQGPSAGAVGRRPPHRLEVRNADGARQGKAMGASDAILLATPTFRLLLRCRLIAETTTTRA